MVNIKTFMNLYLFLALFQEKKLLSMELFQSVVRVMVNEGIYFSVSGFYVYITSDLCRSLEFSKLGSSILRCHILLNFCRDRISVPLKDSF